MGRMEVEAWGWLNGYRSVEENRCTNLQGLAETSRWLKVTPLTSWGSQAASRSENGSLQAGTGLCSGHGVSPICMQLCLSSPWSSWATCLSLSMQLAQTPYHGDKDNSEVLDSRQQA